LARTPQPTIRRSQIAELLQQLSEQAAFVNAEVIPWVLRLVMIGLGLSLTLVDFKRIIVFPKAVTIGLIAQLVGLPAAAFGLSLLFGAPPAIAVGLVILAACPSGVTANAYTFASRADVPLCVTLSALTSVITVFTIPFFIDLALRMFYGEGQITQISPIGMLTSLMTFTLLPLAIGMVLRALFPEMAEAAVEPIRKVVLYLMMLVLLLGIISSYQDLLENGFRLWSREVFRTANAASCHDHVRSWRAKPGIGFRDHVQHPAASRPCCRRIDLRCHHAGGGTRVRRDCTSPARG
jgi:predicted Na+-dependent transporter